MSDATMIHSGENDWPVLDKNAKHIGFARKGKFPGERYFLREPLLERFDSRYADLERTVAEQMVCDTDEMCWKIGSERGALLFQWGAPR